MLGIQLLDISDRTVRDSKSAFCTKLGVNVTDLKSSKVLLSLGVGDEFRSPPVSETPV